MNNAIKFCVIFLTSTMFLTSCGSLSVTKRQHSKGYFVSTSKNYSTSAEKEKVVHTNELATDQTAEQAVKVKTIKKHTTLTTDVKQVKISDDVSESKVSDSKQASFYDLKKSTNEVGSEMKEKNENQPRVIKAITSKVKSTESTSERRDRSGGHSLLWIIIIVLLILWALGLIGGLGTSGLLHLLLVVALVLLILWLLRII